jgi:hypothetical protein
MGFEVSDKHAVGRGEIVPIVDKAGTGVSLTERRTRLV